MSIFDQMSEDDYSKMLTMGWGSPRGDLSMASGQQPPDIFNSVSVPQLLSPGEKPEVMPEAPQPDPWREWIGDPSGFVNEGMKTPPMPNVPFAQLLNAPLEQLSPLGLMNAKTSSEAPGLRGGDLGSIMAMASQMRSPQQRQQQTQPMGGLMAYLQKLGV